LSVFDKDKELKDLSIIIPTLQNQIKEGWVYTVLEDGIKAKHEKYGELLFRNFISLRAWLDIDE
jgi:hypothetical protein